MSEEDEDERGSLSSVQETLLLSDSISPLTQPVVDPRVESHVIFSFPIRHSWKPPLQSRLHQTLATLFPMDEPREEENKGETREGADVTSQSVEEDLSTRVPEHDDLELFARELREGCLSIGNEVLFHQSVSGDLLLLVLASTVPLLVRWSLPHLLDSSRFGDQTTLRAERDEKTIINSEFFVSAESG